MVRLSFGSAGAQCALLFPVWGYLLGKKSINS